MVAGKGRMAHPSALVREHVAWALLNRKVTSGYEMACKVFLKRATLLERGIFSAPTTRRPRRLAQGSFVVVELVIFEATLQRDNGIPNSRATAALLFCCVPWRPESSTVPFP